MTIGKASSRTLISAIFLGLLLISVTACSSTPVAQAPGREAAPAATADDAENVRLVGSPIVYDTMPGWEGNGLPRTYAFVTDELGEECGKGEKSKSYMFDITHEDHPMPVATFFVPVGDFCKSGGNFGPHQHAETVNGELNTFEDKLAWVAYVNAGVRVVDVSDPYRLREVGHYVPKTNVHTQDARPIQLTDVDIDHRGFAYATDRSAAVCLTPEGGNVSIEGGASCVGTGLFVFEYTGKKPTAARTTN